MKVLLIEDNPVDFYLLREMITHLGSGEFEVEHAGTLEAGLKVVSTGGIDLILLDLNLPDSDGLETLTYCRQSVGSSLPILIISGMDDPQVAIEAVQHGAQDFIVKNKINADLLMRSLRYAIERQRWEFRLRQSEERYRSIFAGVRDAILVEDHTGRILDVNDSACSMYGFTRNEFIGLNVKRIAPEKDIVGLAGSPDSLEEILPTHAIEVINIRANGERFPAEISTRMYQLGDAKVSLVTVRDITDRKRAEEAYRALVEQSLQELLIFQNGQVVFANAAALQNYGYSLDEFRQLAFDAANSNIYPLDRERVFQLWNARQTGELPPGVDEYRILTRDGRIRWVQALAAPIEYRGRPALQLAQLDITERKEADERLRYHLEIESLAASLTARFININLENIDQEIERTIETLCKFSGADRCYLDLFNADNTQIEKVYEWSVPGILNKKDAYRGLSLAEWSWTMEQLSRFEIIHVPNRESLPEAARVEREQWFNGSLCSALFIPLMFNNRLTGYFGFATEQNEKSWLPEDIRLLKLMADVIMNVIVRRNVERELRSARFDLDQLVVSVSDSLFLADVSPEGKLNFRYISPAAEIITGYSVSAFLASPELALDIIYPEDRPAVELSFQEMNSGKCGHMELEYRIVLPDGRLRWVRDSESVLIMPEGQMRLSGMLTDITDRKRAEQELQNLNRQLRQSLDELEERHRETSALNELGDLLQGCLTVPEVYDVFAVVGPRMFGNQAASLYILNHSKRFVETVVSWGEQNTSEQVFEPDKCWAMRRGRLHAVGGNGLDLRCRHLLPAGLAVPYICVPLIAQGDTIGLLYLQVDPASGLKERFTHLVSMVAERIALAIANLRLRESLQLQSIRDQMTGLFNRRYVENTLQRDLRRAARQQKSVGFVMIDIDRFKDYNDVYGHDAGNSMLQAVSGYFQANIRTSDIACRYGGDEFLLVLTEATIEDTFRRVETIREGIRSLSIQYRDLVIGSITVSAGIASYPEHGDDTNTLVRKADLALHQAKSEGRDRSAIAPFDKTIQAALESQIE